MTMTMMGVEDAQAGTSSVDPSLYSPKIWLKSDAGLLQTVGGSTANPATSDPVGQWLDQSGNGNHISQATSANRPLAKASITNSLPAVLFASSTQQWMRGTLTSNLGGTTATVIAVGREVTFSLDTSFCSIYSSSRAQDWQSADSFVSSDFQGDRTMRGYRNGGLSKCAALPLAGNTFCYYTVFDGTNNTGFLNNVAGTAAASTGTFAADTFLVGGTWNASAVGAFFNGYMFELVVYPTALTTTQLSNLYNNYLKPRYLLP